MLKRICILIVVLLFRPGFDSGLAGQAIDTPSVADGFTMVINRQYEYYHWTGKIYTEVFSRLGIPFTYRYEPLKRASLEVNAGRFDGEPGRIYNYGDSYPDLIRVEETVFDMKVVALARDSGIEGLDGWDSLEGTAYFIDYPRGMMICVNNLIPLIPEMQLDTVRDTEQGLNKLFSGRIDLYIDDWNSILPALFTFEPVLRDTVHIAGIMQQVPLYMFVHKRHADLVPLLEKVIADLKAEGLIDQFYRDTFPGNNGDSWYSGYGMHNMFNTYKE